MKHFVAHFFKFLLRQEHMGMEISKYYSIYTFDPIWAKLCDK